MEFLDTLNARHVVCYEDYNNREHAPQGPVCETMHVMDDFIIRCFDTRKDAVFVRVLYGELAAEKAKTIIAELRKLRARTKSSPKFGMIVRDDGGNLQVANCAIKAMDVDFKLLYSEDYADKHARILSRLSKPMDKGIVVFHGLPGTGKTHAIRSIINSIYKKNWMQCPPPLR